MNAERASAAGSDRYYYGQVYQYNIIGMPGGYAARNIAPMRTYHGDTIRPLYARPYAWGWFGARPHGGGGFSRGYYGNTWYQSR